MTSFVIYNCKCTICITGALYWDCKIIIYSLTVQVYSVEEAFRVVIKNRADFGGITFYGCSFHHQEIVDGTVRRFAKIYIHWWCKQRNSSLVDTSRLRATERKLTILSHKRVGK